tara:strand:+ start:364 stop:609 length:246 start_codon:yes stop_codon:yes gene_type:complete
MAKRGLFLGSAPNEYNERYTNDVSSKIEEIVRQLSLVNKEPYVTSNSTDTRTYDVSTTTLTELANVVATLIADLKNRGVLK